MCQGMPTTVLVIVSLMCQGMPTTVPVIVSLCNVLCVRACLPLYLLLLVFVMSYVSGHAYHCTCYC